MKILHTLSVRWWNACAYYAVMLAKSQIERGDEVILAGVPDHLSTQMATKKDIPTIPINFAAKNPIRWIAERRKLHSFLSSKAIDVINCHMAEDHLLTGILAHQKKIPLVRTVGDVRVPRKNVINARLFRKYTNAYIFSSYANFLRYQSFWPSINDSSRIIHGGVDLSVFQPRVKNDALIKKLSLTSDTIIIGNIGRFSKTKDHFSLLRAALLCLDSIKNHTLHFIISGSDAGLEKNDIVNFARGLNIEKYVTVLGPYEPVTDLISLLDIGVISSKDSEAICRIAMEYMAMGIPMVVTDINVLPEIISDGRNGMVVPAESPYELSRAIIQLVLDNVLREQISQTNIADAKHLFSFDKWYMETLSVYKQITEGATKLYSGENG